MYFIILEMSYICHNHTAYAGVKMTPLVLARVSGSRWTRGACFSSTFLNLIVFFNMANLSFSRITLLHHVSSFQYFSPISN